ncbi:META domain-containing protein [Methylocystis sp. WRRC1]|uniref:META domain-containing protein n=1 Tax=Methylocystis sp. WRRC1 TaxID=1732014 RepID=UPI001D149F94|nr:META domain-containing protein [Methylocystis sp. WRRC1]MCC3245151.1 META domain-containing protein [Methylocystis sp. WRRC1]
MRLFATGAACALLALFSVTTARAADDSIVGEWRVERLDGAPLVPGSTATMQFAADGRVAGKGSCNRYGSGYRIDGDSISFTGAMATRMACAPALMRQEARFLSVFSGEARWTIDHDTLTLKGETGVIVHAKRSTRG